MLKPFAPDIWTATHDMRFPGGVRLPTRMTVVRLPDASLWLHSPIPLTPEDRAALDALGPVRHIIAPNKYHHLFAGAVSADYPEAQLFAPPGWSDKNKSLRTPAGLTGEPPAGWGDAIASLFMAGAPAVNEVVFLHKPSRTLITTDLIFNVQHPSTWMTSLTLRIMGTHKRTAVSRLWKMVGKDRPALRASMSQVLAWSFDGVIMAHGEPITQEGHGQVEQAFRPWLA